ncbi:MAG: Holliday junction resolvase RuvX [Pseudomonadota bacterium]|nr:Holliday junction resolvase RuvX [Pseudomonadota bacterium]
MPDMAKPVPQKGCVLGFDFGEKRTGIAVGDLDVRIAHPLTTVMAATRQERFNAITPLVEQWRPVIFVVGLPLHTDGHEHDMTQKVRKFANQLNGRFNLPCFMENEMLTSVEATHHLHQEGVFGVRHKMAVDQAAAQIILQGFFNHLQSINPDSHV